ncbi:MAG: serine hydrolase, partial [Vicinamibacteria bacterium]
GTSFDDYVKVNILDALGMKESTFHYPDTRAELRTTGHVFDLEPVVSEVYPYNRRHAPSSTLNSSVVELTRWARANLNRGELDGRRILAEASYELLWTPSARVDERTQVGLSWFLGEHRGRKVIEHSGGDTGYSSYLTLLPDENLALVLASNYDRTPMRAIREGVLDVVLGFEPVVPPLSVEPQYVSPSGESYFARPDDRNVVADAEKELAADPTSIDRIIALGNAQAAFGRMREAIEACRHGLEIAPDHAGLATSCGQRYLVIRDLSRARKELERAIEIDERMPLPWHHLGVVSYLEGEWDRSAVEWEKGLERTPDYVDSLPAVDWLYMTYQRSGRVEDAARILSRVEEERDIQGGEAIYQKRLLFYRGSKSEAELVASMTDPLSESTFAYALGNWYLYHRKDEKRGREYFERAASTSAWTSLGFIAAEADLARLPK